NHDNIRAISSPRRCQHSKKKAAYERTVGVTENSKGDWDDGEYSILQNGVRGHCCNDDHEDAKNGGGNTGGADGLAISRPRTDIRQVEIFRETGRERVERG